jgi:hypothetical protein
VAKHKRGLYGLVCWNGLSADQQQRLLTWGNLPIGYQPHGECPNPAECGIETRDDVAPGSRFYCYPCGAEYLSQLNKEMNKEKDG